jgi:starch phosphorylase
MAGTPLSDRRIAWFSMEIGLSSEIPTYAGGLGMLAGDVVRTAADLRIPMAAVTLLHRKGYFFQRIDKEGRQHEEPVSWAVNDFLEPLGRQATIVLEGREVGIAVWRRVVTGAGGGEVPVLFLDTDLPENDPRDRALSQWLYGGDERQRLCEEAVLGIGGLRALEALGARSLARFHMNEGHAALLVLELLVREGAARGRPPADPEVIDAVRRRCVFTTHTPVPAAHDKFEFGLVASVVEKGVIEPFLSAGQHDLLCCHDALNMTYLALNFSHYVNGVAKRHGEVSRQLFQVDRIDSITNGVHAATWTSAPFQQLYDRHFPGWREDNSSLRAALSLPDGEVWEAHLRAKRALLQRVNQATNAGMDADVLTLGFARRATAYKRPELLLHDAERLRRIAREAGPLQVIYAGKAHSADERGKDLIRRVVLELRKLRPEVLGVWVPGYDMELARLMVAGTDVWLNTPQPPLEASGTSGMKAALNGVPSLSVLDGWWVEGCVEGVTGWAIGEDGGGERGLEDRARDAESLYRKLERAIVPAFYKNRARWAEIMRHASALNGSFFNSQRMMQQYVTKAYFV